MDRAAEYAQLIDEWNAATDRRNAVVERFRALIGEVVDPSDPIHEEWDAAEGAERIARERASTFYHQYLRIRR